MRLQGTSQWILEEPAFLNWPSNTESRILCRFGDPGAGKTIIR